MGLLVGLPVSPRRCLLASPAERSTHWRGLGRLLSLPCLFAAPRLARSRRRPSVVDGNREFECCSASHAPRLLASYVGEAPPSKASSRRGSLVVCLPVFAEAFRRAGASRLRRESLCGFSSAGLWREASRSFGCAAVSALESAGLPRVFAGKRRPSQKGRRGLLVALDGRAGQVGIVCQCECLSLPHRRRVSGCTPFFCATCRFCFSSSGSLGAFAASNCGVRTPQTRRLPPKPLVWAFF